MKRRCMRWKEPSCALRRERTSRRRGLCECAVERRGSERLLALREERQLPFSFWSALDLAFHHSWPEERLPGKLYFSLMHEESKPRSRPLAEQACEMSESVRNAWLLVRTFWETPYVSHILLRSKCTEQAGGLTRLRSKLENRLQLPITFRSLC